MEAAAVVWADDGLRVARVGLEAEDAEGVVSVVKEFPPNRNRGGHVRDRFEA